MAILLFSLSSNAFGTFEHDFENPDGTVHENITQYIDYSVSLQAYVFLQIALDAISYIINNLLSYIASTIYFKIS